VFFLFHLVVFSLLSTLLHAGVSLLGVGTLSSAQRDSSLTALPPGSFLPPNATFAFLNHSQSSLFLNDLADKIDGNAALFTRVEGEGMVLSMDRVLMQSAGGFWMHEKEQSSTFARGSASLRFHFLNAPAGSDDGSCKAVLSITHSDKGEKDDRNGDDNDSAVSHQSVVDITTHSVNHASGPSMNYVVTVNGSVSANDYHLTTTTTTPSSSSALSAVIRDLIVLNQSVAASITAVLVVVDGPSVNVEGGNTARFTKCSKTNQTHSICVGIYCQCV